jgi:hypothetical protein
MIRRNTGPAQATCPQDLIPPRKAVYNLATFSRDTHSTCAGFVDRLKDILKIERDKAGAVQDLQRHDNENKPYV